MQDVVLRKNIKMVLTGFGRVGHGAREIMKLLPIKELGHEAYLQENHDKPVFTDVKVEHYFVKKDEKGPSKTKLKLDPLSVKRDFKLTVSIAMNVEEIEIKQKHMVIINDWSVLQ